MPIYICYQHAQGIKYSKTKDHKSKPFRFRTDDVKYFQAISLTSKVVDVVVWYQNCPIRGDINLAPLEYYGELGWGCACACVKKNI